MSQMLPLEGLLKNLKGEIPSHLKRLYLPREFAYRELCRMTGQSFSIDDIESWEKYVQEVEPPLEDDDDDEYD